MSLIFGRRCYSTSEMGPLKVKDKLNRDIQAHVASVRAAKLSELCAKYDMRLLPSSHSSIYYLNYIFET
jgi:hypothetical protein